MNRYKNILKSSLYMVSFFIISTLIMTALNYFNVLNYKIQQIVKVVIPIFSFFLGGFVAGKGCEKKGWLEGIKLSSLLSFLLVVITLLLKSFKMEYSIYIVILMISGILGSMIGINKK